MCSVHVPVWEKYTLTVEEASKYFRIGENKLRRLAEDKPTPAWVMSRLSGGSLKNSLTQQTQSSRKTLELSLRHAIIYISHVRALSISGRRQDGKKTRF